VIRRFALIYIIVTFCLTGCFESGKFGTKGLRDTVKSDRRRSVLEYLLEQDIDGLESIGLWKNEYGPGLKLTTAHYEIFTTLLEPLMLRMVPSFLESAYRNYNGQLPEPIETKIKFTVYIFAHRAQWEDFTRTFAGRQAELFCKIKAGAYYLNGACVTYNIGIERTFSALGHEGWHQFNSRLFKFRLPSWLDEGVAMLFEQYSSKQEGFCFEPAENTYRLNALEKTLMKNKMLPLKELIAMNPSEVLATDESEAVMAFYSQSYALVRFLLEADGGKRLANYQQLLFDGLKGKWPLNKASEKVAADRNIPLTVGWNRVVGQFLFRRYIGEDFGQLEREYLAFCQRIIRRTRGMPQN